MTFHTQKERDTHFDQLFVDRIPEILEGEPLVKEETLEEVYASAYMFYQNQHYKIAGHLFRLLTAVSPTTVKFWKACGACLQMQKNYEEALDCYISVKMLKEDVNDPYLYIQASDCYFALKQVQNGLKALDAAQSLAKKNDEKRILQHVAFMREIWSKKNI